jgi:PAS domain S-box-containing protein
VAIQKNHPLILNSADPSSAYPQLFTKIMNSDYPVFGKYAGFLLNNHLDTLINDSILKAREANLPILNQLAHFSEEQLFEIAKRGFTEDILIPLTESKPFSKVEQSILNWKANALILPKEQINLIDITGIYYARKISLIELLSSYDYSKEEGILLLKEMEEYFTICINLACNAYEEIQRGVLQESQETLNGILSNIPVIVSRIDKEGNMLQSVGSGLASLGVKDGDLVGTNVFKNYPNAENTRRAINGEKVIFQGTAKSTKGEPIHYQSYFFPQETGAIGFSIDITEQKIAEEKLREKDYFIKQVADATPFTIHVYDRINHVDIYSNKEVAGMLGYSSEQITSMGKTLAQIIVHPDDFPKLIERSNNIEKIRDGEIVESEMRVKDAKGEYHWLYSRTTVFKRTTEGKVWQTLSTSLDVSDKKKIEEKLQQQLRIFDTALSNTVDFNYIFDLKGRFTYINKPMLDLWGKTQEEALGRNFKELGYPDELASLHESQIREVIETKQSVKGENEHPSPEGRLGYYQYIFVPVYANDGNVEAVVGTTHDITGLKEAAEKQYRSIFESTKDAILIYDEDGFLVEVNPAGFAMHGFTHQEMIGMNGKDFIHQEDHRKFLDFIKQVKEGKEYFASMRHLTKDGRLLFVEKTGATFTFKGKPRFLAVVHDVTERIKAEEALKESEDRFRSMADNIPNLAWMADEQGWIFWYNRQWFDYTGTTLKEMEGWGWQKVHHPDYVDGVVESFTKSVQTGQSWEHLFPLRGKDGTFRWFISRAFPIRNEEGKITRWFGTNTDITEQKKSEASLEAKNKELLKINNDLDNFIYTASHDLKAPVSNIEGLINTLYDSLVENNHVDSDIDTFIKMINTSLQRFQNTIKDLTEITKIQKRIYEEAEDINLNEIFDEVRTAIATQVRESGAVIKTDFHCEVIKFSRINFKSIIHNLLTNAIKYKSKDRKPEIHVTCIEESNWYILEMIDNGMGIAEGQKDKIFGMFKRLHDHVEGSGVGLYLVKRIVDNAEGKIEVESVLGEGSIFRIYLPIR